MCGFCNMLLRFCPRVVMHNDASRTVELQECQCLFENIGTYTILPSILVIHNHINVSYEPHPNIIVICRSTLQVYKKWCFQNYLTSSDTFFFHNIWNEQIDMLQIFLCRYFFKQNYCRPFTFYMYLGRVNFLLYNVHYTLAIVDLSLHTPCHFLQPKHREHGDLLIDIKIRIMGVGTEEKPDNLF